MVPRHQYVVPHHPPAPSLILGLWHQRLRLPGVELDDVTEAAFSEWDSCPRAWDITITMSQGGITKSCPNDPPRARGAV